MGEGSRAALTFLLQLALCATVAGGCTTTRRNLTPLPGPSEAQVSTESPRTFAFQDYPELDVEDRPYTGTVIEDPSGKLVKFYYIRPGRSVVLRDLLPRFTGIDPKQIEFKPEWGEKKGNAGYELMLVTGTSDEFALVDDRLDQIEAQVPMVEIEAHVVELTNDDDLQLGIQTLISEAEGERGDNPRTLFRLFKGIFDTNDFAQAELLGGSFQGGILELGTIHDQIAFDFVIQALVRNKLANILSAPKITVLDGFQASITIGDQVPIQTFKSVSGTALVDVQFKEAAIKLEVTPYIVGKESIRLDIKPEVTRITSFTDPGPRGLSNPILSTRSATTSVIIRSGYTFVIGGLIGNTEIEDVRKTPILGDIPLIKYLFRSTRRQKVDTNLMFLIRPRIRYPVYYGKASERIIEPDLDNE